MINLDIIPYKMNNYEREEKNGIMTIYSTISDVKFLNNTGQFIYKIIDGKTNVANILKQVYQNFSNTEKSILDKDTINFILSMKNLNYIGYKGALIMEKEQLIHIAAEADYAKLSKFYINYLNNQHGYGSNGFMSVRNSKYYITANIRTRAFYSNEVHFICSSEENVIASIGVSGFNEPGIALTVTSVLYAENIDVEILNACFKKACEYAKKNNRQKIKVVFNGLVSDEVCKLLSNWGFQYEAKLLKESGNNDYIIYSLIL